MTFEEDESKTQLVLHDLHPSAKTVDMGSTGAMPEVLDQLKEFSASLGSSQEKK